MTLTMTKQETVIKICKLTRITGEIKYQIDFDGNVDFASFVPNLLYIDKWTDEICRYVSTDRPLSSIGAFNLKYGIQ